MQVKVDAQAVKQLRQMSGAGMMDAKKALLQAGGDVDKALETLRKKGLASADKKAGRLASEGAIGAYIHAGSRWARPVAHASASSRPALPVRVACAVPSNHQIPALAAFVLTPGSNRAPALGPRHLYPHRADRLCLCALPAQAHMPSKTRHPL